MKLRAALPIILALAGSAFAQTTTLTTVQDACNGKVNQFCTLQVSANPDNGVTQLVIDNRNNFGNLYLGAWPNNQVHGAYSGFVSNPDGTRNDFYGTGSFVSDDGTVNGTFNYRAHYVSTCSGRGCGGTLGWHYLILTGSTVEVQ